MANPLYGIGKDRPQYGPLSNISNILSRYNQFRSSFSGDPRAKVDELLRTGQMSQEQLDQLIPLAQQLQNLFGK